VRIIYRDLNVTHRILPSRIQISADDKPAESYTERSLEEIESMAPLPSMELDCALDDLIDEIYVFPQSPE
jgi:hypothetical protein